MRTHRARSDAPALFTGAPAADVRDPRDFLPEPLADALPGLFGLVGEGRQRPMELATLRLAAMADSLREWGTLAPRGGDEELLLQRGGAFVFGGPDGSEVTWSHLDRGILGHARGGEVAMQASLAAGQARREAADAAETDVAAAAT